MEQLETVITNAEAYEADIPKERKRILKVFYYNERG